MKRKLIVGAIIILTVVMAFLAVMAGGGSAYDLQGLALVGMKLALLMIWVLFFQRIKSATEEDDIEKDWERINEGNMAVSFYRSVEFGVLVISGTLLLSKV